MSRRGNQLLLTDMTPEPSPDLAIRELTALYDTVSRLRQTITREAAGVLRRWSPIEAVSLFGVDPVNLAHYLALRRHDLGSLQRALAAHGLSSLGRSEARVVPSLDALIATLARLIGRDAPPYPTQIEMTAGERAIECASERIFGPTERHPKSRVLVTLPTEAGEDDELIERLMATGMNCARINCSHDNAMIWAQMIANIRKAEAKLGRRCPVLMDIGGPKCRIVRVVAPKTPRVYRGDRLFLVADARTAKKGDVSVTINFPHLVDQLTVGNLISLDDGVALARVLFVSAGSAELEISAARKKGLALKADKGMNLPSTCRGLPVLTPKDHEDLDFIANNADLVGFSFVQRPEDIELLQENLALRRKGLPPQALVLKIETPEAVKNLPRLILQSATRHPTAVMIARGDLAVEIGFARLSEIQEEILWLCEAAHTPVIWATEVLSQFVKEGVMNRPETTDAAVSQQADCVMLNKGPYLEEGVGFLVDILERMKRHHAKKFARFTPLHAWDSEFDIL